MPVRHSMNATHSTKNFDSFPSANLARRQTRIKNYKSNPKSKLIIYKSISLFVCVYKTIGLEAKKGSSIIFTEGRGQGRIYVANEYPTFVRTMLMVSQKQSFLHQITLNVRQNLSVLMKICKFQGKTYRFLNFSAPYCRESKYHPTCRVVGIPKYATGRGDPMDYGTLLFSICPNAQQSHGRFSVTSPVAPNFLLRTIIGLTTQ